MSNTPKKTESLTYEQAMQRLETLTRQMENSEIGIDELSDKLREAQSLAAFCKQKLTTADESIRKILEEEK